MDTRRIGRYLITGVLGRGAVGTVYRARDPVIDREVAVKTIPTDLVEDGEVDYRARFLREVRAAGRMHDPGIVTVFDVGEDEEQGVLYLAMEFVDGASLKELLGAGTAFEPAQAASLGISIAEALDAAHRNGVVHRDIKPANVLLARSGAVKIADFGVARLDTSDLTRDGSSVGTPYYMAPEQIQGRPVDGRADLYSLGVILFEMVTGQRPHSANGIGELAYRITHEQPEPLAQLVPDVPAALADVVDSLLAKARADRIQTGAEVATRLRHVPGADGPLVVEGFHVAGAVRAGPVSPGNDASDATQMAAVPGGADTQAIDASPTTVVRRAVAVAPASGLRLALLFGLAVLGLSSFLAALQWRQPQLGATATDGVAEMQADVEALRRARLLLADGAAERAHEIAASVLRRRESAVARELFTEAERVLAEATPTPTATATPRRTGQKTVPRRRSSETAPTPRPTATPQPPPRPTAVTRPVRLAVEYDSPLTEGSIVVEVDFDRAAEIRFDFTGEVGGPKGFETGTVRDEVRIPAGGQLVDIQLHAGRRGQIGLGSFEREFPPGSAWKVVISQPSSRARPTFDLVRLDEGP